MMNKSKIDWCDFSWNPVTGCLHTCEYCYARKQARRFSGDIKLNLASDQLEETKHFKDGAVSDFYKTYVLKEPFKSYAGATVPFPAGFAPTLHEYRLAMPAQKKKPANIFVGSMADLFGDWVPEEWLDQVFEACAAAPWHNYLFLTKNPQAYALLADMGKLPQGDNYWYGTTVTGKGSRIFSGGIKYHTFLSIEPLQESLDAGLGSFSTCEWIIVGAETGHRKGKVAPKPEWIANIVKTAKITQAAVFLKDSKEMRTAVGDLVDKWRELPPELQHKEEK